MTDSALTRLTASPAEVLQRLPGIGRVMILNSTGGVTHERIGEIATVEVTGDEAVVRGPDHDSRIALSPIAAMIVDRSSVIRDKAFPRIDFRDAAGRVLFSAVSFAGMEPFDAALAGFAELAEPAAGPGPEFARGADVDDADPGRIALDRAQTGGQPVVIRIAQPGFTQRWEGVVEAVKPSMGFLNVLVPNFHFHLKGGSVGSWSGARTDEGEVLTALDPAGQEIGLQVVFPA